MRSGSDNQRLKYFRLGKHGLAEEPVSRLWACIFSPTIFALFWTSKMKKTRIWIAAFVSMMILGIILRIVVTVSVMSGSPLLIPLLFLPGGIMIYLMFRWTTEFNQRVFGYKSKKGWRRAGSPDPPPVSEWFEGK